MLFSLIIYKIFLPVCMMSCAASGCPIMDHVKTQMPYVLGFAAVSPVLYLICGFVMQQAVNL